MPNVDEILRFCFNEIGKIESVRLFNSFLDRHPQYIQAWELTTTITLQPPAEKISFIIAFRPSFPYSMPDIYYNDTKYDYFPHIDYENRKFCLYEDEIAYDVGNPLILIITSIRRAKEIIIQGVSGKNTADFLSEIKSYWNISYNHEPTIEWWGWVHSLTLNKTSRYVNLWIFSKNKTLRCKGCIVEKDDAMPDYMQQLKSNYGCTCHEILYIGQLQLPDKPPYDISTNKLLSIVSKEDTLLIKRYINQCHSKTVIVFKLGQTNLLGGFYFEPINTNRKGFRPRVLTPFEVISKIEQNKKLPRILVDEYSSHRITIRTSGESSPHYKFVIAGLGSIGSNLCHFLNSANCPTFTLIDSDILSVDNIGRHLLGFNALYKHKVEGVKEYLKMIRPEQNISVFTDSIESVLSKDVSLINKNDCLFLATGNIMSELFIRKYQEERLLTIPVFIIWLEPYGLAGHMVYLNPNSDLSKISLYSDQNTYLYKYNLIHKDEYNHSQNKFIKRDAGCNGAYTLYSNNDVMAFLSAIYPKINTLIRQKDSKSHCYRWNGDISLAKKYQIKLVNKVASFSLEEFSL